MNKQYLSQCCRNLFLTLCVFFVVSSASPYACAQAEDVTPAPTGDWVEIDGVAYRTLKVGAMGDDVLRLKKRMQEFGLFLENAELTDTYNITMEEKIKQYQKAMGERATGIATPELQALMYSQEGALATPTPEPTIEYTQINGVLYRNLNLGDEGEDVLRLKQRLQAFGMFLDTAKLTDLYNITMVEKIKQYQKTMGERLTGAATSELQAFIFSEEGVPPTPTPTPTIKYTEIDGVLYRDLALGDEGEDVLRLKKRMQEFGLFLDTAELTDSYNITMEEKIKQYQKTMGKEVTGVATPALQVFIYSQEGAMPTATPAPTIEYTAVDGVQYRTLKLGSEGEDVLRLKQGMQKLGYFADDAELTGTFNITMEERVKQLQRVIGERVTGTASPQFQATILSGKLPTPTPAPQGTPAPDSAAQTVVINGVSYRTLQLNSKGDDVTRFKRRLQELGYFAQNGEISEVYTGSTVAKVKQYQKDLGLEATGIASPELQAMSYTDYGGLTTPVPLVLPTLPTLTEEGFLPADSDDEFVYKDSERGQWIYISSTLRVEINRYHSEGSSAMVWFETTIRFTESESFQRYDCLQKYKNKFNSEYPNTIATRNNVVLGFSDDFYAIRKERKNKQGIIIVDGKIVASEPYERIVVYLPPLDLLALFPDGSAKAFYTNEYSAEALLAMGVQDTLCFGPVLLREGQLGQQVADGKYSSLEPRCALGMIEPRSYVLISVEGRLSTSQGASLNWIARRMQALGVQEALNLDGGNTTALVFCGELLNKVGTYTGKTSSLTGVRSVSSIMSIGQMHTPLQLDDN